MMKQRLDKLMVENGMVPSRSQAQSIIKLGQVRVGNKLVLQPSLLVKADDHITITASERYVSRAGLKLASAAAALGLNFTGKLVLDVGSSTGGFTDYALQHGALKVIAVDVGTDQMHESLRRNNKIELHEKTDIRALKHLSMVPNIVLIDVSFISLRHILPYISGLVDETTDIVAMFKPQFEAGPDSKHKGVIKNDRMRRSLLEDFERWLRRSFIMIKKADSQVLGAKGNKERFYLLRKIKVDK